MKMINTSTKEAVPLITESLRNQQDVWIKVTGHSMRPFLKHHIHSVRVRSAGTYQKYDIVLYLVCDKLVLHRIIRVEKDYVICGDALSKLEYVPGKMILGKVIEIYEDNQLIDTRSKSYRFKLWAWLKLKPFRRIFLKLMKK